MLLAAQTPTSPLIRSFSEALAFKLRQRCGPLLAIPFSEWVRVSLTARFGGIVKKPLIALLSACVFAVEPVRRILT